MSQVYPALGRVPPPDLFGVCVVGTNGNGYAAWDADTQFEPAVDGPGADRATELAQTSVQRLRGGGLSDTGWTSGLPCEQSGDGHAQGRCTSGRSWALRGR